MQHFTTNDGIRIAYHDIAGTQSRTIILIHGFTGSSAVFQRNVEGLSKDHRLIMPDLRGHGQSGKPESGYHVARLAMDLKNLIDHLQLPTGRIIGIGASLGAAILWSFAELFTTSAFSHMVFVDQAPLQNYTADGSWGPSYGNLGCNSAASLANLQATLRLSPASAHKGTIASCLGYRSHPLPSDIQSKTQHVEDENFFLDIAMQGDGIWYGNLMADHTSLDWRDSIRHSFGRGSGSTTKVLVIASNRSGCFPPAGPMMVVDLVNGMLHAGVPLASGVVVDWGGHWCYWEDSKEFDGLVQRFL